MQALIEQLRQADTCCFFTQPVDVVALHVPHYRLVIKQPMDLQTCAKKLRSKAYASMAALVTDLRLMFTNARLFNTNLLHPVHIESLRLEAVLDAALLKKPAAAAVATKINVVACRNVLSHLLGKYDLIEPFLEPTLPGAPKPQPTCMRRIFERLGRGEYASHAELGDELELMWQAYITSHGALHPVSRQAVRLRYATRDAFFDQLHERTTAHQLELDDPVGSRRRAKKVPLLPWPVNASVPPPSSSSSPQQPPPPAPLFLKPMQLPPPTTTTTTPVARKRPAPPPSHSQPAKKPHIVAADPDPEPARSIQVAAKPTPFDPPTKPMAEPPLSVHSPEEPLPAKPMAKSLAASPARPMARPVAKPVAKPIAKPVAKPIAKPVAKPIAKPMAKTRAVVKPTLAHTTKPLPLPLPPSPPPPTTLVLSAQEQHQLAQHAQSTNTSIAWPIRPSPPPIIIIISIETQPKQAPPTMWVRVTPQDKLAQYARQMAKWAQRAPPIPKLPMRKLPLPSSSPLVFVLHVPAYLDEPHSSAIPLTSHRPLEPGAQVFVSTRLTPHVTRTIVLLGSESLANSTAVQLKRDKDDEDRQDTAAVDLVARQSWADHFSLADAWQAAAHDDYILHQLPELPPHVRVPLTAMQNPHHTLSNLAWSSELACYHTRACVRLVCPDTHLVHTARALFFYHKGDTALIRA